MRTYHREEFVSGSSLLSFICTCSGQVSDELVLVALEAGGEVRSVKGTIGIRGSIGEINLTAVNRAGQRLLHGCLASVVDIVGINSYTQSVEPDRTEVSARAGAYTDNLVQGFLAVRENIRLQGLR